MILKLTNEFREINIKREIRKISIFLNRLFQSVRCIFYNIIFDLVYLHCCTNIHYKKFLSTIHVLINSCTRSSFIWQCKKFWQFVHSYFHFFLPFQTKIHIPNFSHKYAYTYLQKLTCSFTVCLNCYDMIMLCFWNRVAVADFTKKRLTDGTVSMRSGYKFLMIFFTIYNY